MWVSSFLLALLNNDRKWSNHNRKVVSSDVSPWPWSLKPKSLSLALQSNSLALALRVVLGLECLVWLRIWYKPQVTKMSCCTGVMVSAASGNMYRHMVMALFTYHLSSVSNLHLILGLTCCNLLGLMWVRGLRHQVLGLGVSEWVGFNVPIHIL